MLKWRDSTGSWDHRAFWGANLINEGTLGTASRYWMGTLPQTGSWVRLVVPAATVGMEGKTADGMAFTAYDGQAWFDLSGKSSIGCLPVVAPPSLPNDMIWFDDQVPTGAQLVGSWVWDSTQKVSGAQSHTDPANTGLHYHYFHAATQTLPVSSSENLVTYVLINPCNPPQEIMLQWQDETGSWEHRAIWGQDLIAAGTLGTASRYPMGSLPTAGEWVRLQVPAALVGMSGRTATGMSFALYGGEAWFDRPGKAPSTCITAQPPASLPNDTIWFDDQVPTGGQLVGTWVWDGTQKVSGAQSHTDPANTGLHYHYFHAATQTLPVSSSENLVTYVLINPCNPPQEIMLQWQDETGSWEHRAFWGQDLITGSGTLGTASRYPMGTLPQSGEWVRLEVPAALVAMGGRTATGMSFALYGGEALFDRAGKAAGACATAAPPPSLPSDTVWFDDQVPTGGQLVGTWVWDGTQKVSGAQSHTDPANTGLHYHYFHAATQTLSVSSSENLVTYVLINPCNPPQEIMLQWQDESGTFEHRAFWGQDLITGWGTLGTASRYSMGPLPIAG
jgi:hypothetical protein